MSEDDVFQQAVNYIFTGRIDPKDGPEIVDPKACIVVGRPAEVAVLKRDPEKCAAVFGQDHAQTKS